MRKFLSRGSACCCSNNVKSNSLQKGLGETYSILLRKIFKFGLSGLGLLASCGLVIPGLIRNLYVAYDVDVTARYRTSATAEVIKYISLQVSTTLVVHSGTNNAETIALTPVTRVAAVTVGDAIVVTDPKATRGVEITHKSPS